MFLARSNHDPLESGPPPVRWPGNVTVFGSDPSRHSVERGSETLAVVHGIRGLRY